MIKAWVLANRTHVIYTVIIVLVGLVTNYFFGRFKTEEAGRIRWEKAYAERKVDVRVVTKVREVRVPVEVAGQVVYKVLSSWDEESLDKTVENFGSEVKEQELVKKVEGQIPVFTLGLGARVADQLDLAGHLNARLYGPLGAWVMATSEKNFNGYGVYLGASYSR